MKKHFLLALMTLLPFMGAWAEGNVAKIGSTEYETFEAAFAAAEDGDVITLLADCAGNGIKAPQSKFFYEGLTVDFNGFTYTVDGATVGSTGTQTNGFQLLKDNKITFKNGTIYSEKAKILVQNYSNLTLKNMTLTLNNTSYAGAYTLSDNNGNVVIDGSTINANPTEGSFAFDVCRYSSYPSVFVEVKGDSKINGNVEISASGSNAKDGFGLTLTAGSLLGDVVLDASAAAAMEQNATKAFVMKADDFNANAPEGFKWENGLLVNEEFSGEKVTLSKKAAQYTGQDYTQEVSVVRVGSTVADYTIEWVKSPLKNAGVYKGIVMWSGQPAGIASFEITPADLSLVATGMTKVYGEPDPDPIYTLQGFVNGETSYDINIEGVKMKRKEAGENVGIYSYVLDIADATWDNQNYALKVIGTATQIQIVPATLTATIKDAEKVFYAKDPEYEVEYTGFVGTETVDVLGEIAPEFTRVPGENVGEYDVTAADITTGNYTVTFEPGKLTITPRNLADENIEWKVSELVYNGEKQVFGIGSGKLVATLHGELGDYQLVRVQDKAKNDYAISSKDGYENNVNATTEESKAVAHVKAGQSGNFKGETSFEFDIKKASLTITADAKTKTFGTDDPVLTYTAKTLFANDQLPEGFGVKRAEGENVGEYVISFNKTADELAAVMTNYVPELVEGKFTIAPEGIVVIAEAKTKKYGEADPELTYTVSVEGVEIEGITIKRTEGENVGRYDITVSGPATSGNYAITYQNAALTITKAALKLIAEDKNSTYGSEPEALTWKYEGLANGDTKEALDAIIKPVVTPSQTIAATTDAGTYVLTMGSGANQDTEVDQNADNYDIQYVNGVYTVNKATLSLTVKDVTAVYGEEYKLDIDWDKANFVNGNDKRNVNASMLKWNRLPWTADKANGDLDNVGEYDIIVRIDDADFNHFANNYEPAFENEGKGKLTITKAPLTVKVNKQEIVFGEPINTSTAYGQEQPTLTLNASEFKYGEQGGYIRSLLEISLVDGTELAANKTFEKVIQVKGNEKCINYEVTSINGDLTVNGVTELALTRGIVDDKVINLLKAYNGQTLETVRVYGTKNLTNVGYWYSLSLPFETTTREISDAFGYAVVNVPDQDNTKEGKVVFKLNVNKNIIPANTLILIQVDDQVTLKEDPEAEEPTTGVVFENKKIVYDPEYVTTDKAGNKFHPTYTRVDLNQNAEWFLWNGTFWNAGTNNTFVSALQGYFEATAGEAARIYVQEANGSYTAIESIDADTQNAPQGWFNVNGVKYNNVPTQKGVYINNGKKIVVK